MTGRAAASIGRQGGEVVADLAFATGRPNTPYEVKLIQMPRSSADPCPAGAVGVSGTTLFTDGAGAATLFARVEIGENHHRLGIRRAPGGIQSLKLSCNW